MKLSIGGLWARGGGCESITECEGMTVSIPTASECKNVQTNSITIAVIVWVSPPTISVY